MPQNGCCFLKLRQWGKRKAFTFQMPAGAGRNLTVVPFCFLIKLNFTTTTAYALVDSTGAWLVFR